MAFVCSILSLLSYLSTSFLFCVVLFWFSRLSQCFPGLQTHTVHKSMACQTPKTNVRCLISPTKQAGQLEKKIIFNSEQSAFLKSAKIPNSGNVCQWPHWYTLPYKECVHTDPPERTETTLWGCGHTLWLSLRADKDLTSLEKKRQKT